MKKIPILTTICAFISIGLASCGGNKPTTYTVSFKNYDGTLLSESSVKKGETATYNGPAPTRAETDYYTYTFTGWDQPLTNIVANCSRIAQYSENRKTTPTYTVSFKNYDGTLLSQSSVLKGETAIYNGPAPTKPETEDYVYTFVGWDQPLTNILSDCNRVAQYSETAKPKTKYYTVTFKNYDGTVLSETTVEEGKDATYKGLTPSRASTNEFSFTFTGWDLPLTNITSNCVRVAQYSQEYIEYTVRFYNYNNELLDTATVHYGEDAIYHGVEPTKPSSATHYYTFKGWDKEITNITKNLDVKATYNEYGVISDVIVNPNNGKDGTQIEVRYGENYNLGTPTFPGFTFLGWYIDDTTSVETSGVWQYYDVTSVYAKWKSVYFAFEETANDTLKVSLTDEGKAAKEIIIPASFNGKAITALADNFSKQNTNIEKVNIAGSISVIPSNSFSSCSKLKEVTFNEGLTTIGAYAFNNCALEKVMFPSTCTNIGDQSFDKNSNLYQIYIPKSVSTVGSWAFDAINSKAYICLEHETDSRPSGFASNWSTSAYYTFVTKLVEGEDFTYLIRSKYGDENVVALRLNESTAKLQNYTFPDEIEGISDIRVGRYLWNGNLYIRNVNFNHITRIGTYSFANCSNLVSVTFDNTLTIISDHAFQSCKALTRIEIPESVTEIQGYAFDNCSGLTYIYLPKEVATIGSYAFDACNNSTIYTNAHTASTKWETNWKGSQPIYYDFEELKEMDDFTYVIQSYLGEYYVTITGLTSSALLKKNIVIPDIIDGISDIRLISKLFINHTELVNIDLGESIKSVPSSCFQNLKKLETVTLHEGVTTIGTSAFNGCNKLSSINMPSTLTTINSQAFDYCFALREVVIPMGVTTIGTYAFDDSNKMALLMEQSNVQSGWASTWFGQSNANKQFVYDYVSRGEIDGLRYAKTSNGVTESIFILGFVDESTTVTSVVIPNEIEGINDIKIAKYAFADQKNIKTIDLGESVTFIGSYAFKNATSLISVIIPNSCLTINEYAFQGCSTQCIIHCEAVSIPSGWNSNWNSSNCQVDWGYIRN